jgi:hypothetical protein
VPGECRNAACVVWLGRRGENPSLRAGGGTAAAGLGGGRQVRDGGGGGGVDRRAVAAQVLVSYTSCDIVEEWWWLSVVMLSDSPFFVCCRDIRSWSTATGIDQLVKLVPTNQVKLLLYVTAELLYLYLHFLCGVRAGSARSGSGSTPPWACLLTHWRRAHPRAQAPTTPTPAQVTLRHGL